jgi:hypothetical protein
MLAHANQLFERNKSIIREVAKTKALSSRQLTDEQKVAFDHLTASGDLVMGVSAFATIVTCLLLVWLIIPKPTLPLTSSQIMNLRSGQLTNWPKLSKKEQQHWIELGFSP